MGNDEDEVLAIEIGTVFRGPRVNHEMYVRVSIADSSIDLTAEQARYIAALLTRGAVQAELNESLPDLFAPSFEDKR